MKHLVIFLAVIFLGITATAQQKTQRFAIKSGYVKYDLSGNTVGTEELWWDDYGNKTCSVEKSVTTTKVFGMTSKDEVHTLEIMVKDKFWSVNYIDNTATKGDLPYYDASHEIVNDLTEKEQEELAQQILESLGGEIEGKEKVNGYNCDVYSLLGTKSWIYKGVLLKMEGNLLGFKTHTVASIFKPNSKVPSSKFTPPADVEFENLQTSNFDYDTQEESFVNDDENGEDELEPITYDFEKFKTGVMPVTSLGYKNISVVSNEGAYVAMFMKGLGGMLSIGATSDIDNADADVAGAESFTHNGRQCWYNTNDGGMLIVHYKSQKMYIIIVSPMGASKTSLLKINDTLSF